MRGNAALFPLAGAVALAILFSTLLLVASVSVAYSALVLVFLAVLLVSFWETARQQRGRRVGVSGRKLL